MKDIFEYDSYRIFLKDYFNFKAEENPKFSQRYYAKKANFGSASYFSAIISNKRNLTQKFAEKTISAINLNKEEADYFRLLVQYENSKSYEIKKNILQKLQVYKKNNNIEHLTLNHIHYYDKWYIPIIRHLAVHSTWNNDYNKLGNLVQPKITSSDAKKAIDILLKIGLLKNKNNKWEFSNPAISVNNLPYFIKAKAREKIILDSIEKLKTISADQRYTSCTLISISDESYKKIEKILKQTKNKILKIVDNDINPEQTVAMLMQMFPYSGNYKDVK